MLAAVIEVSPAAITATLAIVGAAFGLLAYYVHSTGAGLKEAILKSIEEKFSTKEVMNLKLDQLKADVHRIDGSNDRIKDTLIILAKTEAEIAQKLIQLERFVSDTRES